MKGIVNLIKTEAIRLGFYIITALIGVLGCLAAIEMERQGLGTELIICMLEKEPLNLPGLIMIISCGLSGLLINVEFIAFRVEDILWIKRKIFR